MSTKTKKLTGASSFKTLKEIEISWMFCCGVMVERKNASSADRMKDVKSRALPIRPASKTKGTRGDNKVVLKAHPYALLDASLALQNEYTLSTTMVLIQQPYTPFPSQVQATGRDEALKTPSVHTVLGICQEESDVSSLLDKTTPSQRRVQAAKPTRQKTPHNEIKV
ncbi:hypothetical protein F2Q70_00001636 [Brassica cretica]|uniref:Uncharacterized protein n=1 Tax=Brassica cretica TaxID=69181 RepID=A0A8S9IY26_BRACR|nr:hypothetical protein F2Q70_00001636 [Brassica cretica]